VWAATGLRTGTEHNILANPTSDPNGALSSYRFDNYRKDLITTSEIGARGEVTTLGVLHRISATGSIFDLNSKNAYAFSSFAGFAGDLYDPTQAPPPVADFFTGGVLLDPKTTSRVKTSSIALADMVSFVDDRVRLMAGGRFQRIAQYSYDYNTGDPLSGYDKKTVTPAVGLVVKPTRQVSLYANYIEALVQGDVAPLVSGGIQIRNHDEIFAPFRSRQYEVGAKYDSGTIGGTLALFRVNKPSALVVGDVYTHDGEQRNQGIELSWYGEAARDLNILGGITILDAKVLESQGGLLDGKRITGVPDVQANLGLEWGVPLVRCLTLDGHLVTPARRAPTVPTQRASRPPPASTWAAAMDSRSRTNSSPYAAVSRMSLTRTTGPRSEASREPTTWSWPSPVPSSFRCPWICSRPAHARPAPGAGTNACKLAEQLVEMGLIGQATVRGNLTERGAGRQHQPLRALHPAADHVAVGRIAETVAEGAAEVKRAQACDLGQTPRRNGVVEICLYVGCQLADLPGGESPAYLGVGQRGVEQIGDHC
jgi:hypothetical protein